MHDVLHARNNQLPESTILKMCKIHPELNMASVLWGRQHESAALACYQSKSSKDHRDLVIQISGQRLHETFHVLGASVVAVASCKCHGKFLTEIKFPYKHRETDSLIKFAEDPNFCLDGNFQLKENHRYMTQVQMQMNINKIKKSHLVIWTPVLLWHDCLQGI